MASWFERLVFGSEPNKAPKPDEQASRTEKSIDALVQRGSDCRTDDVTDDAWETSRGFDADTTSDRAYWEAMAAARRQERDEAKLDETSDADGHAGDDDSDDHDDSDR